MPNRTIEITTNQVSNLSDRPLGSQVNLSIVGRIISNSGGKAIVLIESVLGRSHEGNSGLDELLGLQREILGELKQLPKVQPLGET